MRKRDETWLSSHKLLTRDLAPRTSFTFDSEGDVFLVGGTAVVPPDLQAALPLLAYLNSSVANSYLAELTPSFRGAFQKFEPQHLSRLPIPMFIVDLDDTALQLGDLAQRALQARVMGMDDEGREVEDMIDEIVARTVSLDR